MGFETVVIKNIDIYLLPGLYNVCIFFLSIHLTQWLTQMYLMCSVYISCIMVQWPSGEISPCHALLAKLKESTNRKLPTTYIFVIIFASPSHKVSHRSLKCEMGETIHHKETVQIKELLAYIQQQWQHLYINITSLRNVGAWSRAALATWLPRGQSTHPSVWFRPKALTH